MKKHKSHHIFAYLGLLVLLFVTIFGIQFFKNQYNFIDIAYDNSGTYEDGINQNPFTQETFADTKDKTEWITFGFNDTQFAYPEKYQLRIDSDSLVYIVAPHTMSEQCNEIIDEQLRAECFNPPVSPYITINTNALLENPFETNTRSVFIDGEEWSRTMINDEYGGMASYKKIFSDSVIEVRYYYNDVQGGRTFETLHSEFGDQYQLTQSEQESLVREIIKTIKFM